MKSIIAITFLAGCNSLLGIPGNGEVVGDGNPGDVPPPDVNCEAVSQNCALFAVDRDIVQSPGVISLEGTFGNVVTVEFPGAAPGDATMVGSHRALIAVPSTATTGVLSVTTAGRRVGNVPFRNTSFKIGVTHFQVEYPQTSGARQVPFLSTARGAAPAVVIKDRVHVIGGRMGGQGSTSFAEIEVAVINADGTLGRFETGKTLTTPRAAPTAHVIGDHLYVIGGTAGPQVLATTETAPIIGDGELGAFVGAPSLTTPRGGHTSAVIGDNLYVFGGQDANGSGLASVERARINPDATLGNFEIVAGVALTTGRVGAATVVVGNKLYVLGGQTASDGVGIDTIERASINSDGTLQPFEGAGTMASARAGHTALVLGQSVVVIGGIDANRAINPSIERAVVTTANDLGPFAFVSGRLAIPRAGAAVVVANNNLHLIGGFDAGGTTVDALRAVEHTSLIADGNIDMFALSNPQISVSPRTLGTYAVLGRRLHVFGALDSAGITTADHDAALIGPAGDVQAFSLISTNAFSARLQHAQAITGNEILLFGGLEPTVPSFTRSVESAQFSRDGTVDGFLNTKTLEIGREGMTTAAIGDRLYVFGGDNGANPRSDLESALLGPTGGISDNFAVVDATFSMSKGRSKACIAVIKNFVYHVGGLSGNFAPQDDVERFEINPGGNGFLGASQPRGNKLSSARGAVTCAVVGRFLYVFGGDENAGTGRRVERAEIDAETGDLLGNFTPVGDGLATRRFNHRTAELGNGLYMLGGDNGSNVPTNTIERTTLR